MMTVPQNVTPLIYCNAYEKTRESLKIHLNVSSDKLVSALAGKFHDMFLFRRELFFHKFVARSQ